jgi:predicted transcriptional regulator
MTVTVRITPQTHETLKSLAEQSGETMQAVLDRLVAQEREALFWQQTNAAYAALRADEAAWQEEIAERALWENTLMDGLDDGRGK